MLRCLFTSTMYVYCLMNARRLRTSPVKVIMQIGLLAVNLSVLLSMQGVFATLTVIPERTDQPRIGDSVTLDCKLQLINPTDVILWEKTNITSGEAAQFVENGELNSNADDRFSLDQLTIVSSPGNVFSQKVKINSIQKSDEGLYSCIDKINATNFATAELNVFFAEDFPVCSPDGKATVMIGSSLSCRISTESRSLSVAVQGIAEMDNGWTMSPSTAGEQLTRTVTNMDNGTTFICFSLSTTPSRLALSCTIGPLTVSVSDSGGGLTTADIAGIVVGSIVLIIIIALHFLCCPCTPRRWARAKSYLLDIGSSSFGISNQRNDSAPDQQHSMELGNSLPQQDDVPPSYESATEPTKTSAAKEDQSPCSTSDPEKVESSQSKQGLNIAVKVSINIAVSDVGDLDKTNPISEGSEKGKKPRKIKRFAINRKGKVNKGDVPDINVSDTQNEPNQNPSVMYAKVNKRPKGSTSSEFGENPDTGQKLKKIKRFAVNRKGKVEKAPPKPEPVIVYANLDLPVNEQEGVRSPKEPWTVYAEIKH